MWREERGVGSTASDGALRGSAACVAESRPRVAEFDLATSSRGRKNRVRGLVHEATPQFLMSFKKKKKPLPDVGPSYDDGKLSFSVSNWRVREKEERRS